MTWLHRFRIFLRLCYLVIGLVCIASMAVQSITEKRLGLAFLTLFLFALICSSFVFDVLQQRAERRQRARQLDDAIVSEKPAWSPPVFTREGYALMQKTFATRLLNIAYRLGIPVVIRPRGHEDLVDAIGTYSHRGGNPLQIAVCDEYWEDSSLWLLLAHELGHHAAIQRFNDRSEEAADREGFRLARSVMTDDELRVFGPIIDKMEAEEALEAGDGQGARVRGS